MKFESVFRQLRETAALMTEIERSHTGARQLQAENVRHRSESMRLQEQRVAHIDGRLSSITLKLGLMGFKGQQ